MIVNLAVSDGFARRSIVIDLNELWPPAPPVNPKRESITRTEGSQGRALGWRWKGLIHGGALLCGLSRAPRGFLSRSVFPTPSLSHRIAGSCEICRRDDA